MLASTRIATIAAALAVSASLALAQPPAAPPAPSNAPATGAAPQAPAPPARRIGRIPQGDFRGGPAGGFRGGPPARFGGGPGERFHGSEGRFRGGPGGHEIGVLRIGPRGTWWKNPRIVERLSLTADQTRKMDDIVEQSRLQLIDLRANLEKQQVLLRPILDGNPVDTAKASAQIDKVANARADLEKANAKMLLSIRGVLTPDQWTKLHERPTPPAQGTAPAGGSGAAAGSGAGRWRGGRPGGSGGNGMDDVASPVDEQ